MTGCWLTERNVFQVVKIVIFTIKASSEKKKLKIKKKHNKQQHFIPEQDLHCSD